MGYSKHIFFFFSFLIFLSFFRHIQNKGVFLYYCNRRDPGACVHRQKKPILAILLSMTELLFDGHSGTHTTD